MNATGRRTVRDVIPEKRKASFLWLSIWITGSFCLLAMISCKDQVHRNSIVAKPSVSDSLTWVWEDSFSKAEQEMLRVWIEEVIESAQLELGPFPFSLGVHFYRNDTAEEPVPWAHTRRSGSQSLHFHVNPSYTLQEFRADWTAPHEVSHVAIPFLGRTNAWFSEGFATYMQCQVMERMGIMTQEDTRAKYRNKIETNKIFYEDSSDSFIATANRLVGESHNYPALYWGGVTFFIHWNEVLVREKGITLNELIRQYQEKGRMEDDNLDSVIATLDSISGVPVAKSLLTEYRTGPAIGVFAGLEL